jgi:hypothetical protein
MRNDAFEQLVESLTAANEAIVRSAAAGIAGPIASVGLYDNDFTSWLGPGTIHICSEQQRTRLLAAGDWEAAWAFWDYEVELLAARPDEHAEWEALAAVVREQLHTEISETHAAVLEIVRRLNDPERLPGVERTDDFVVYRAERFPQLIEDLNVSTPPATLELLRARHRVPVWMDSLGRMEWR